MLAGNASGSIVNELGKGDANPISYSPYGHRSAERTVSTHLGYNGEIKEAQTGCYLLGNGYRAFNPVLMKFHSPDSWSPFGEGGVNGYAYCNGDPVNGTDPTGHTWWKSILNFTRLRKPSVMRAPAHQGSVSQQSAETPRRVHFSPPENQSGVSDAVQPGATLPPYSREEGSGRAGQPRLPTYEEDHIIAENSSRLVNNEALMRQVEAGGIFARKGDRAIAIAQIKRAQRDIRRTNTRLLNEPGSPAPRTSANIESEQARNRALLRLRINQQ